MAAPYVRFILEYNEKKIEDQNFQAFSILFFKYKKHFDNIYFIYKFYKLRITICI